jgi:hypothetical protein
MAKVVYIDTRQPVEQPKPRRRKQTHIDPDNLPSWDETQEMFWEMYGEVPAFLRVPSDAPSESTATPLSPAKVLIQFASGA